ncbi:MAG: DUF4040 domain-containing protein, partial [Longimicrobiales bacterium]|nr:DUF4040 domain-containing protein [Longimicrobiales bacterium]
LLTDLETQAVTVLLLALLCMTGLAVVRMRNLLAAVMLMGIYSFLGASWMLLLDAPDVAFTEAAVGAGISTVLLLSTLALVGDKEHKPQHTPILPLFVVIITGAVLVYGTSQMPPFGHPENPANLHVAPHYLEESYDAIHIPNVVTSVLASYRSYDTMGETVVVFTALVGVLLLLARGPLPRRVYRDGEWITVRPGTTREELSAQMEAQGGGSAALPASEAGGGPAGGLDASPGGPDTSTGGPDASTGGPDAPSGGPDASKGGADG